jgi:hypothetical protein
MKKKLTEEEKEIKRAYDKAYSAAYRKANKEAIAIKMKAHYQANKESILIKQKTYDEANREAILIKNKAYDEANKESISIYKKARYESRRLPHHIVYCLPKYNKHGYVKYAGVTDVPCNRMNHHKHSGNNTDEWFVLHECETREEALKIEAEYHKKGYAGGQHNNKSINK